MPNESFTRRDQWPHSAYKGLTTAHHLRDHGPEMPDSGASAAQNASMSTAIPKDQDRANVAVRARQGESSARFLLETMRKNDPRAYANAMAESRRILNRPQPGHVERIERERGERVRVTVIIAHDGFIPIPHDKREPFETFLADTFGGWTDEHVRGGWVNEHGVAMQEDATRYTVSFDPDAMPIPPADVVDEIAFAAAVVGRALGEEWVHIESETVQAHHIKC